MWLGFCGSFFGMPRERHPKHPTTDIPIAVNDSWYEYAHHYAQDWYKTTYENDDRNPPVYVGDLNLHLSPHNHSRLEHRLQHNQTFFDNSPSLWSAPVSPLVVIHSMRSWLGPREGGIGVLRSVTFTEYWLNWLNYSCYFTVQKFEHFCAIDTTFGRTIWLFWTVY